MSGLKHGELIPDISGASEAQSPDHLCTKIGNNIAIQIGCDEDVVVEGILQQPHAHGINVRVVHLDLRVVLRDLLSLPRGTTHPWPAPRWPCGQW